jgi:hypothetical protein
LLGLGPNFKITLGKGFFVVIPSPAPSPTPIVVVVGPRPIPGPDVDSEDVKNDTPSDGSSFPSSETEAGNSIFPPLVVVLILVSPPPSPPLAVPDPPAKVPSSDGFLPPPFGFLSLNVIEEGTTWTDLFGPEKEEAEAEGTKGSNMLRRVVVRARYGIGAGAEVVEVLASVVDNEVSLPKELRPPRLWVCFFEDFKFVAVSIYDVIGNVNEWVGVIMSI